MTLESARAQSAWLKEHLTQNRILRIHSQTLEHTFILQNVRYRFAQRVFNTSVCFVLTSIITCCYPFVRGRWRNLVIGAGVVGYGVSAALFVSAGRIAEALATPRKIQSRAWIPENLELTSGLFKFLSAAGDEGIHWEPIPKQTDVGAEDRGEPKAIISPSIYSGFRMSLPVGGTRFIEIEPGTFNADIRCRMSQWSAIDEGYTALSYVWGNDTPTRLISVNSRGMLIRKNLDSAIRHIRKECEPLSLWVDAICINQQDPDEKNAQVEMMSDIYQQAKRVLVFLGEGEELSTLFIFIQDIDDGSDIDGVLEKSDLPTVLDQFWQLLQLPWWSRVWVIQEFAYAEAGPTFVYGHYQFSARCLWHGFEVLRDVLLDDLYNSIESSERNPREGDFLLRLWGGAGSIFHGLHILRSRQQLFSWRQRPYPARSKVSDLLKDTQFHHATDPRDRLFGLHSLMMDPFRSCFLPDYHQSTRAANIRMATYLLCIEGWTEMYNYFPTTVTNTSLPSWVPDFSASLELDERSRIWDSSPSLCLGELDCWVHRAVLGTRGIDCGKVTNIAGLKCQASSRGPAAELQDLRAMPCPQPPQVGDHDSSSAGVVSRILADTKPEPGYPVTKAELADWGVSTTRWLAFANAVRAFDAIQDHGNGVLPDDELKSIAEMRDFIKLQKNDLNKSAYEVLEDTRLKRRQHLTALEIEKQLAKEPVVREDDFDMAWKQMRKIQLEERSGLWQDGVFRESVFTTDTDFVGLCPPQAQVADRLIVLFGMPTPFLARVDQSDGTYLLVGPVRANKEALKSLEEGVQQGLYEELNLYFK